ncbi:MAG: hypothetical protein EOP85_17075 [Verrucomicrobiaceae bacterium]|nr:MAG: hypothetical protein EOP85_17075 [Verrucomicrobiaceae bacterium]
MWSRMISLPLNSGVRLDGGCERVEPLSGFLPEMSQSSCGHFPSCNTSMNSQPPPLTHGPPPLSQGPPPGWWARNWKWMVPTCAVVLVGGIVGFIYLLVTLIMGLMKSSEPFKVAMERANASEQMRAALGTPVESGMFVTGNINTAGASGSASLGIPISGPNGKGNIYVEARKSAGTWTYTTLEAHIPGQPARIDLKP